MQSEDRSWATTVLTLVVLAAVAWLVGGGVEFLLRTLGEGADFSDDVGALSAIATFLLLLGGYFFYAYVPSEQEDRSF